MNKTKDDRENSFTHLYQRMNKLEKLKEAKRIIFSWNKMFFDGRCVKEYWKLVIWIDPASKDWDRWCTVRWCNINWIIYFDEVNFTTT